MSPDFYTVAGKPPDPFFIVVGPPLSPTPPSASDASKVVWGRTPHNTQGFIPNAGHARIRLYYNDISLGLSIPKVTQEAGYGLAEESDLHPVIAKPSYPPESPGQDTLISGL
jgi:hypothetical protein